AAGEAEPWRGHGQGAAIPDIEMQFEHLFKAQITAAPTQLQKVHEDTPLTAQSDFAASMRTCLAQVQQTSARIDRQAHLVADIQQRQAHMEKKQGRVRGVVAKLEHALALAESEACAFDAAKEVERSISQRLADAGVAADQVQPIGDIPAGRFFLRTTGSDE
ncbi:unnamed protein product, partial [Prorocentrum cordatum]